jgi:hypothetical protein
MRTDDLDGWKRRYLEQGIASASLVRALDEKILYYADCVATQSEIVFRLQAALEEQTAARIDAEMMRDAHETDVHLLEDKLEAAEDRYQREFTLSSSWAVAAGSFKAERDDLGWQRDELIEQRDRAIRERNMADMHVGMLRDMAGGSRSWI